MLSQQGAAVVDGGEYAVGLGRGGERPRLRHGRAVELLLVGLRRRHGRRLRSLLRLLGEGGRAGLAARRVLLVDLLLHLGVLLRMHGRDLLRLRRGRAGEADLRGELGAGLRGHDGRVLRVVDGRVGHVGVVLLGLLGRRRLHMLMHRRDEALLAGVSDMSARAGPRDVLGLR